VRRGLRSLAILTFAGGGLALLAWVAPPGEVLRGVSRMNPLWVAGALALELASCLSYVVLFRRFFPEPPPSVSREVAWTAMGAGAVLPGGNFSSAAATGWLLRRHGIGTKGLLERCGALLCLLTAFGFLVNGVAGLLLLARVPDGPHDVLRTCGPILVSVLVLGGAWGLAILDRRLGALSPLPLRGVAAALRAAWQSVRHPHWRLLGAAGFLGLDMAALWAACAATGHHLGVLPVVLAYCIGYLATLIPVPAGIGVLDSGLGGTLVLYGMSPAAAVAGVLVYHFISIWLPGVGGLGGWLLTRRRHRRALLGEGLLADGLGAEHAASPEARQPPLEVRPLRLPVAEAGA
jgi:uncharacterized membrane protein YbhN (UPF0104 family)